VSVEKSQRTFSSSSGNADAGGAGGRRYGSRGGGVGGAEREEALSAMEEDGVFPLRLREEEDFLGFGRKKACASEEGSICTFFSGSLGLKCALTWAATI